ncbi:hypothetical protein GUK30_32735 [Rhizobium leguminosarum]|uniref:hypothetical protein n=1 Tax=Rhizobium ruizarguesonis TaxID=2081791 RepID=UPI0013C0A9F5|nr:hypothetical protein [Rhizobium ruizarguesonis]NEI24115.1 hypothetical protein [Rhizobium ruizarguesonis]
MTTAVNMVRGTIALVALTVLIGTLALNPFVTGWVGGFVYNRHVQNVGLDEAHERYFRTICADYYNASFFERWTSTSHWSSGWCSDYKDRL